MADTPRSEEAADAPESDVSGDDSGGKVDLTLLRRDLRVGFAFLTRLPVRLQPDDADRKLADAAWTFPVVGVAVGLTSALGLGLGTWLGLPPLACAVLAIAAGVLFTGALHEDGLADVADGFGGGEDKRAKLRIMRDSRIGAFGVIALVLALGMKAALIAGMDGPGRAALALVAAAIASRAALPLLMTLLKPARRGGLGAGAGRPERADAVIAALIGGGLVLGLVELETALSALLATAAAVIAVAGIARRQIGGVTGDVLGASQQMAEIAVLAAIASVLP